MKTRISALVITLLIAISAFSQTPQAFKYQTVVRDVAGDLIQDQNVSFRMSVWDMDEFGVANLEYQETHSATTNQLGLVNFNIGGGNVVSGAFTGIEWGINSKVLEVELDPSGGSSYTTMGYTQLLSVPYSLYAESTGDIDEIVNFAGDTKINMPFNDKSIRFISQDIEFMRMTSAGYLGIGTTTPNEELEIHGSIRMQDGSQGPGKIMVSDGMGTASWTDPSILGDSGWTVSGNSMYSSVSGNVGIGTSYPGAKLAVAGHIWQTGLGNSVFIGQYAGENDDLSDNRNVFIGHGAGKDNTTGNNNVAIGFGSLEENTEGVYNIAIGSGPLYNNTSGFGNIALGFDALSANTSGDYNYAVGEYALQNNTSGEFNIATGTWALVQNTVGDNNIGMGNHSLTENITGNNNIAVGKYTLSNNTTGYSNVAIGARALNNNTTKSNLVAIGDSALYHNGEGATWEYEGERNTAIGSKALYSNTTGNGNTANGYQALYNNIDGQNNTAIGSRSLYSNTTGYYNTSLGSDALNSNTTGGSSTAIGKNALKYSTTGSNNAAIGMNAMVYNSTGSSNVGIGTGALYRNQGGDDNIAIGGGSLFNNEGDQNSAFGREAGYSNTNGNNNVFLGYHAGYNETGSNKLYIENSDANSNDALIYGEFDNDILKFHADVQLTKSTGDEMIIKNDNQWEHYNGVHDFGDGGDYFIMASKEGSAESAGIFGDGNHTTIWSPGDAAPGQNAAYLYMLDEDGFTDADGNPYNNGALKAYLNTSGNWISVSDKNKKENIKPLSSSLDKLMNINGYSYSLKQSNEEKSKGIKQETTYGVLAQEVETVLPEIIEKNDDGEYFVSYTEFIPVLIEAIKEQQQTIEKLQEEVNQLKKK
jgi:hypothetical protein